MIRDHYVTDRDRLIVARLDGIALRYASSREPTEAETSAAVTELREAADGRPDLLAEVAGLLLGFHEGNPDESRARAAAHFCVEAAADTGQIMRWIEEGRRRAETARHPPFSSPRRTPAAAVSLSIR